MSAIDTLEVGRRIDVDAEVPPAQGPGSTDIAPIVESVLRAAIERLDAEAAAAHAESSAAVAAAVRRSAELMGALGAEQVPGGPTPVPAPFGPSRLPSPEHQELGPELGAQTPGQVYDLFWAEIPADQPIRERLRRWAQRPPL